MEGVNGHPTRLNHKANNINVKFERLWAPWRIGYVSGKDRAKAPPDPTPDMLLPSGEPSCFLCRAAAEPACSKDDRTNRVVWRRNHTVTLLNRYPYNNGHLLIAPRHHIGNFQDISPEVHAEIADTIGRLLDLLQSLFTTDGFNIGLIDQRAAPPQEPKEQLTADRFDIGLNLGRDAGAGLPEHLHWHIVPRWRGDHNFMPVLASTRVIPQSLDAAWELLHAALEQGNEGPA